MSFDPVVWQPDPGRANNSNLARMIERLRSRGVSLPGGADADAFQAMHAWSIDHPEEFWAEVWRDGGVIAEARAGVAPWDRVIVGANRMAPPDPDLGPR